MSKIQECYWLIPPVRTEYSRKCFGIITPSTKVERETPICGMWIYSRLQYCTKARRVENRPSAKSHGTPKSLLLENHTNFQHNT
jgi:hypothetical protein